MNNNTKNIKQQATRLFAKNARPKTLNVILERGTRGNYHIIGAEYLNEVNQYKANWRRVDARNLTSELKKAASSRRMLTVN